jgi:hypothetical protein
MMLLAAALNRSADDSGRTTLALRALRVARRIGRLFLSGASGESLPVKQRGQSNRLGVDVMAYGGAFKAVAHRARNHGDGSLQSDLRQARNPWRVWRLQRYRGS